MPDNVISGETELLTLTIHWTFILCTFYHLSSIHIELGHMTVILLFVCLRLPLSAASWSMTFTLTRNVSILTFTLAVQQCGSELLRGLSP